MDFFIHFHFGLSISHLGDASACRFDEWKSFSIHDWNNGRMLEGEGDRHFAHNSWGGRKEDYGENLGFSTKWISTIKNNIRGHFPTPVVRQLYSGSGRIYKGNSMTTMKKKLQKPHCLRAAGRHKRPGWNPKKSLMPLSLLFFRLTTYKLRLQIDRTFSTTTKQSLSKHHHEKKLGSCKTTPN